jgi:hypothetical protein
MSKYMNKQTDEKGAANHSATLAMRSLTLRGIPRHFDVLGGSIFLYPTTNYSQARCT